MRESETGPVSDESREILESVDSLRMKEVLMKHWGRNERSYDEKGDGRGEVEKNEEIGVG